MSENRIKKVLLTLGVLVLLIFCLAPFLWMLVISFSGNTDFLTAGSSLKLTWENYQDIIFNSSLPLFHYLKNSLIVSAVSALFATLFATLSAYAITRFSFPGKIIIPVTMLA
ncbi:MAG: carbohydrate ABC transporter permease, partial [Calditrichaeota bacterium]